MIDFPPPRVASAPAPPDARLRTMVELFGQDWVDDFTDPIVFRNYSLSSKTARQFYMRDFAQMSRFLWAEVLYRRRPEFDVAMLDGFVIAVARKFAAIQARLAADCQRLHKLCESNGQPEDAAYVHPQLLLVPIIAAQATSYMRCLVTLDELHRLSGSATLNGVIDGSQRKNFELDARKAMRSLNGLIRHEYTRLRAAAERLKSGGEVSEREPELAGDDAQQGRQGPGQPIGEEPHGESGPTPDSGAVAGTMPAPEPVAALPDAALSS